MEVNPDPLVATCFHWVGGVRFKTRAATSIQSNLFVISFLFPSLSQNQSPLSPKQHEDLGMELFILLH